MNQSQAQNINLINVDELTSYLITPFRVILALLAIGLLDYWIIGYWKNFMKILNSKKGTYLKK
jgi:hypothetical protein